MSISKPVDNFASPPKVPLAFRVGVVGHRPNRLKNTDIKKLKATLKKILGAIKEEAVSAAEINKQFFQDKSHILRAISPLAEGTDRYFAEQAIDLGYELCSIMPFIQAEFENDFSPATQLEDRSLDHFRELLDRAEKDKKLTRFELEGSRQQPEKAYAAAGRVVLNQSDILVVVWDGFIEGKSGGTEETFVDAMKLGVPVIWVDACAPDSWQILNADFSLSEMLKEQRFLPDSSGTIKSLKELAATLLAPPFLGNESKKMKKDFLEFLEEKKPWFSVAIIWKIFRQIIGEKSWPLISFRVKPFERSVIEDWPNESSTPLQAMVNQLRPFYAWPDKLAVIYSNRYRSTFILAFLLAALAVGFALLPIGFSIEAHSLFEKIFIGLEAIIIGLIIIIVLVGKRLRWHEHWIDYRLVAELVRHMRLVAPLGGERPFPKIPAHWSTYGQPGATWMAWYVQTVERYLGLSDVVVDQKHLKECLNDLSALVKGQVKYHESNARCYHNIEHRLHWAGIVLLGLTLLACLLHLLPGIALMFPEILPAIHYPYWAPNLLTAFCGFFPALGAAMVGIMNQGEFLRISKRSKSMAQQMKKLQEEIEAFGETMASNKEPSAANNAHKLEYLASNAAHLMIYEVLDWRVVFLDRPLTPPA